MLSVSGYKKLVKLLALIRGQTLVYPLRTNVSDIGLERFSGHLKMIENFEPARFSCKRRGLDKRY